MQWIIDNIELDFLSFKYFQTTTCSKILKIYSRFFLTIRGIENNGWASEANAFLFTFPNMQLQVHSETPWKHILFFEMFLLPGISFQDPQKKLYRRNIWLNSFYKVCESISVTCPCTRLIWFVACVSYISTDSADSCDIMK